MSGTQAFERGQRRVLVTDAEFTDLGLERAVIEGAGLELDVAQCRTPAQVVEAARGAAGLIVQYAPITAEVLRELDTVGVVSRYGVGVDNVDVAAASELGIWVANVPDYGTEEVAAHTVALLLGLVRHTHLQDREVREGTWDFASTGKHHRLSTMTLGLVGLGRIGRTVAERAGPWFGSVVAYDPLLPDDAWPAGVGRVELDEAFATCDALSLHLPLTDETRELVGRERLASVPDRGIYLVNTARGGLVDLDALVAALDTGAVRAAALDVLPQEPPDPQHPILRHPRAVVTPHAAWYSEESERDLRRLAAENVVTWLRDGRPRGAVAEPAGGGRRPT